MWQTWTDEFLGWLPKQYGNLEWIVVPFDQIWLPDTYLYNR